MPLDILYLSVAFSSIFRVFRLVKMYKFFAFLDRTERHTNYPNVLRTIVMMYYLFAIFHWNACFTNLLSSHLSEDFIHQKLRAINLTQQIDANKTAEAADFKKYLKAFYFSTKIMTLVGDFPNPKTNADYLFAIFQLILALFLFATIMGHVSYIVSNLGNARKDFQCKLLKLTYLFKH